MSVSVGDRDLPVGIGAVAGAGAWLVGYVFTFVIAGGRIQDSPARQVLEAFGAEIPTWKVVGWVWYNAHFVDTVSEGLFGGSSNYVGGDGFTPLLFVIPPLLLLVAGLAVGRASGATDPTEAAVTGLTVTLGYFVLSLAGVFLFAVEGGSVAPAAGSGIVVAGVLYPVVFGVAGAVGASLTSGREQSSSSAQL